MVNNRNMQNNFSLKILQENKASLNNRKKKVTYKEKLYSQNLQIGNYYSYLGKNFPDQNFIKLM